MTSSKRGAADVRRAGGRLAGSSTAALALAMAALAAPAMAQTASDADPVETLEDIVVTASRIKREDVVTATPVTAVTAEDLRQSGASDIGSFVNELPSFLASNSPSANDSSGAAGATYLNLRGLGPKRTLVLVNGRRHVGGSLDTSMLPTVALERIDVVTGGASAAWGSDAVAGVVNIIYDRKLSGLRMEAQYGVSEHGDAQDSRVSMAAGDDFADGRGHFLITGEYNKNTGILDQKDRDWGAQRWGVIRNPLDTGPNDGIPARLISKDVNILVATEGGLILGPGPISFLEFTPGGGLTPFDPGTGTSPPYTIGGSAANFGQYAALLQPYERANAFAAVDYKLTDHVTAFAEGGYAATDAHSDVVQSFVLGNLLIKADNAFLSPELSDLLTANNIPAFAMGRLNTDMGFMRTNREQRMHRAVLGLKGDFGKSWTWETYFQYGKISTTETITNNFNAAKFAFAADAVKNGAGDIVCRATLNPVTAAAAAGCVPLNLFGFGSPSREAIDYVGGTSIYNQDQTQSVWAAEIGGELIDLWAGPLQVAAGVEHRKDTYKGVGDSLTASGAFLLGSGSDLAGSVTVTEVFGEALLPLLADQPFAKRLDFSAAARLTNYDTIGDVTTWKLGLVWDTDHAFTFRGSLSRDIRAPNIAELFSPQGTSFLTPSDPCDAPNQATNPAYAASCAAAGLPSDFNASNSLIKVLTGGNPNLREETATTQTVGFLFAPRGVPGLRASFDWYDIKVEDAIQLGTPAPAILENCYGGTYPNSFCAGITRDASGQLVSIASTGLNIAEFHVSGIDGQVNYSFSVPALFQSGDARVSLGLLGAYLIEQSDTQTFRSIDRAGELRRDNSGMPKWRWNASAAYTTDRFGVSTQVRYIGGGKYDNTWDAEDINDNSIDPEWYVDLQARVPMTIRGADLEIFGGINNLFDNDPAIVPYELAISPIATNPGIYDTIGRYFYAGIRIKM